MDNKDFSEWRTKVAIAAGVSPRWLLRKRDPNWLMACYQLLTAGDIQLSGNGVELSPTAKADVLSANAHLSAWIQST